jgi:hypothetical protein
MGRCSGTSTGFSPSKQTHFLERRLLFTEMKESRELIITAWFISVILPYP